MDVKVIAIVCKFEKCSKNFQGRTYQKFCSKKCQDADYYDRMKLRRKKFQKEVKCDNCGEIFLTKRLNAKRCSKICRQAYIREYSLERNKISREKRIEKSVEMTCIVCDKKFKTTGHVKKTCSKACSKESQQYFYRKIERDKAKKNGIKYWESVNYVKKIWPLTTNESVPVSNFRWPPSSQDTSKATAEFLKAGGKIRHFDEEIATDLISDNPFCQIEVNAEEAENELFGIVKAL